MSQSLDQMISELKKNIEAANREMENLGEHVYEDKVELAGFPDRAQTGFPSQIP